jgi:L-alanine-DL-glutamate epimerase-like enolase superfamily enzyme
VRFSIRQIEFFERDVRLRLPFRFGVVTLTHAPQAFVRARIRLANGEESWGASAEMLVPKWFDKRPEFSNDDNIEQLRTALRLAREAYVSSEENTAWGHWRAHYDAQISEGAKKNLNALTACYGPALLDRALLDALCRTRHISFYDVLQENLIGADIPVVANRRGAIAARHTVGLVDPIAGKGTLGDGLPETLEEIVARYGHRWFKLKVGGNVKEDVDRLTQIAAVLDRSAAPYQSSLDGNEQYDDIGGVIELWRRMKEAPKLERLVRSIVFVEQPIKRQNALSASVAELAREKPLIIDESDDTLEAFPRAKELGYTGVSSKTCKGLYKSMLNRARCAQCGSEYFMTGEDLTIQAGLALQQDLALVGALGLDHVERNGHHYVNGMAGLPEQEQAAFLEAHPDLYERSHGAVRLKITNGTIRMASLDCPGYASRAMPDWNAMRAMP